MQQLWDEPQRAQPEEGAPVQEPDPLRPPLRRHGPHGELGLHAAAAQLQAVVAGVRGGQEEELDYAHLPAAPAGLFR